MKNFATYVAKGNINKLAEDLVIFHPKEADDLYNALGAFLQDAQYGVWSEFSEEGLMKDQDAA